MISQIRRLLGASIGSALFMSLFMGLSTPVAAAEKITVKHVQGELTLSGVPKRVLVQDVALLDILDEMGVPIAGVPGDTNYFPPYLKKYASKEYLKTGSLKEPDFEAIAGARADLMIVASRSATKYRELSRILPTIDLTPDNAKFLQGIKTNISTLGKIFDKQARASEMNASIDQKFDQLRAATAGQHQTAIVLVTNAGKLGVYGLKSRLSWIYHEAGFKPVADNIDDRFHGGDAVSFEYLLESNPEWLFVVDRDAGTGRGAAARKLLDNELMHQTKAWEKNQIVYLDPMDAYIVMHGYRSVMNLADQVMDAVKKANAQGAQSASASTATPKSTSTSIAK